MRIKAEIFLILIIIAIFTFVLYQGIEFSKITIPSSTPFPEKSLSKPEIFVSSDVLEQGDTLLIKVNTNTEVNKVSGELGSTKIDFFQPETKGKWVGIAGISPKQKLGKYNLVINLANNEEFKKELTIIERKFPIVGLPVTEVYTPSKISETLSEDKPVLNQIFSVYTPEVYFKKAFIYPLKEFKIVGAYGVIRQSGNFGYQHLGVDLEAEIGTPVYALNDGEVLLSENLSSYGKTLIIDHGLGIFSFYCHLSEFKVSKGEKVKKGDIIALSGDSGYATEPHLPLTITVNGSSVDPLRFIETIKKEMVK